MAHAGFIVEFNNPTAYDRQFRSYLKNTLGMQAKQLPHKTAWFVNYRGNFKKFKTLQMRIRSAIKSNGSALIVSLKTTKAYVLSPQGQGHTLKSVP